MFASCSMALRLKRSKLQEGVRNMLKVQELNVSTLKPWEGNPRLNDHAVDAVARSIKFFGFNVPILCDQNSTIIGNRSQ
jgi:ParB-like chromosome segregation protein Spo0J